MTSNPQSLSLLTVIKGDDVDTLIAIAIKYHRSPADLASYAVQMLLAVDGIVDQNFADAERHIQIVSAAADVITRYRKGNKD